MRITPLDIRKQEFKKSMRGLDCDEVQAFLTTVAEEYEAVLSDNKKLREMIVNLEDRLKEFKDMEKNLRNTLLTAERITAEAKENARKEAALILREAQIDADKSSESIRIHTQQLRKEIYELKKHKDNYITRLRTLVESHQRVIDGFEDDFASVDREIDEIGKMVEKDVGAAEAGARMNREKITEDFAHDPDSKVTWGEEKKREEMPPPVMPKPQIHAEDLPEEDAQKQVSEDAPNAAPEQPDLGLEEDSAPTEVRYARKVPETGADGPQAAQPGTTGGKSVEGRVESDMDAIRRDVSNTIMEGNLRSGASGPAADAGAVPGGQQATGVRQEQLQAGQAQPEQDDKWKSYKVEGEKEDWSSYEVSEETPRVVPVVQPSNDKKEAEVENALSGLKEMGEKAPEAKAEKKPDTRAENRAGVVPEVMIRSEDVEPKMQNPKPQGAPDLQPAGEEPGQEAEEDGDEGAWSMEELRKNLSNITNNEE